MPDGMLSLEEWASAFAGNHKKFRDWSWWDRPGDDQHYGIHYMTHRDADLVTVSNWEVSQQILAPHLNADEPDIWIEYHSHWACGWVEGYVVRVFNADGAITDAARALYDVIERIDDYHLLDEEDYSQREYDAQIESIKSTYLRNSDMIDDPPDDWPEQVWQHLWDGDQYAFCEDGYVIEECVERAMLELGFATNDEETDDD